MRERGQTFLGYVRALHVRLATGDVGRNIVRWSGVAMILSLASGLYLWWPKRQVRIRGDWRSRQFWFGLHNVIGISSLLPLVMLAATGTVLGFEDQIAPLIYKLTRSVPTYAIRSAIPEPRPGAIPITPDEAVAIAQARIPGTVPYRVQMPKYGGVYQVALQYPEDRVTGERNLVILDPYDGSVVSLSRSSDLSRGDRVLAMSEALHTGDVLGMPSRIVVWLASTVLLVQAASGLLIWLGRSKIMPPTSRSTRQEGRT